MGTCYTLYILDEEPTVLSPYSAVMFKLEINKDYELAILIKNIKGYKNLGQIEYWANENFAPNAALKQYAYENFSTVGYVSLKSVLNDYMFLISNDSPSLGLLEYIDGHYNSIDQLWLVLGEI